MIYVRHAAGGGSEASCGLTNVRKNFLAICIAFQQTHRGGSEGLSLKMFKQSPAACLSPAPTPGEMWHYVTPEGSGSCRVSYQVERTQAAAKAVPSCTVTWRLSLTGDAEKEQAWKYVRSRHQDKPRCTRFRGQMSVKNKEESTRVGGDSCKHNAGPSWEGEGPRFSGDLQQERGTWRPPFPLTAPSRRPSTARVPTQAYSGVSGDSPLGAGTLPPRCLLLPLLLPRSGLCCPQPPFPAPPQGGLSRPSVAQLSLLLALAHGAHLTAQPQPPSLGRWLAALALFLLQGRETSGG